MRDLDEIDREILRLLLADARRPYSDIADRVDRSPPAVSDRVDRLQETGVIRSFTIDIDRDLLSEGTPVLVELTTHPTDAPAVREAVAGLDRVEHVFETAAGDVVFEATITEPSIRDLLAGTVDLDKVRNVAVRTLAARDWRPTVGDATLALECVECGNTVDTEGTSARFDGDLYHFCCGSCEANFRERFERLESEA